MPLLLQFTNFHIHFFDVQYHTKERFRSKQALKAAGIALFLACGFVTAYGLIITGPENRTRFFYIDQVAYFTPTGPATAFKVFKFCAIFTCVLNIPYNVFASKTSLHIIFEEKFYGSISSVIDEVKMKLGEVDSQAIFRIKSDNLLHYKNTEHVHGPKRKIFMRRTGIIMYVVNALVAMVILLTFPVSGVYMVTNVNAALFSPMIQFVIPSFFYYSALTELRMKRV